MTYKDLSNICSFIKEQGKNEHVLFMTDDTFIQEFVFMKPSGKEGASASISVGPKYNGRECVAIIKYSSVTLYVIDPATLSNS